MITWLTSAQKALAELNASEAIKQRLLLALETAQQLETQNSALRDENAVLKAQLQREKEDKDRAQKDLQAVHQRHSETVRIIRGAELRRGVKTFHRWLVCCPRCHMPAWDNSSVMRCTDRSCQWVAPGTIASVIAASPE